MSTILAVVIALLMGLLPNKPTFHGGDPGWRISPDARYVTGAFNRENVFSANMVIGNKYPQG